MDEKTIFQTIQRNVLAVVPEVSADSVVFERKLSELGLNSLDRTDVIVLTMQELAITVPVHEFHRSDTIAALVEVMRRYS